MARRNSKDYVPGRDQEFVIAIESIAYGGRGVGYRDGKVVFVADTLPGDRVRVCLKKEKKHHIQARLVSILEPSETRQLPEPGFLVPGSALPYSPGYCYYYTDYVNEITLKQQQFRALLDKSGFSSPDQLLAPVPSPTPLGYRNKIKLHVEDDHGVIQLGYVMANNTTVLDLPACPLADTAINDALAELKCSASFHHSLRQGMKLTLRYTKHDGVSHWRNNPAKNLSWLREETVLGSVSVPCGSFFQVNIPVCNLLLESVQLKLKQISPRVALDFYCGIGLFSLAAAHAGVETAIGIDLDPLAIGAAEYNGKQHNLRNCQFIAGDVGKHAREILKVHPVADTCLIVDPPRTGMDGNCRKIIATSGIRDIIYISCSADTLVRDCGELAKSGYEIVDTQLFDMFPRTAHFESLTHLRIE